MVRMVGDMRKLVVQPCPFVASMLANLADTKQLHRREQNMKHGNASAGTNQYPISSIIPEWSDSGLMSDQQRSLLPCAPGSLHGRVNGTTDPSDHSRQPCGEKGSSQGRHAEAALATRRPQGAPRKSKATETRDQDFLAGRAKPQACCKLVRAILCVLGAFHG